MLTELSSKQSHDDLRWHLLQRRVHEDKIKRAFRLFRSHNIEPILIKGWAASLNYPPDVPRYFVDTDMTVAASDYNAARKLCDLEESWTLAIDLHRELRHLDSLPWADLYANSRLIPIDDTEIRILRPEDHLRVLCIHWLNDGGADKSRLWDVFYAVANRSPDFDWERCIGSIPEHRRKWIISAIAIVHHYLSLDITGLPFAAEAKTIPPWIKRCLESEWASDIRLEPVFSHWRSPASLFRQIVKRIPPNPLRAVIEMEGRIDARTRVFYQIGCFAKMFTHPLGPRTSEIIFGRKNG